MAHFAKLNESNIVEQVIVVNNEVLEDENGYEIESLGAEFCSDLFGGRWIQTSYNSNYRNVFAGVGMLYDEVKNEFIAQVEDESISE